MLVPPLPAEISTVACAQPAARRQRQGDAGDAYHRLERGALRTVPLLHPPPRMHSDAELERPRELIQLDKRYHREFLAVMAAQCVRERALRLRLHQEPRAREDSRRKFMRGGRDPLVIIND